MAKRRRPRGCLTLIFDGLVWLIRQLTGTPSPPPVARPAKKTAGAASGGYPDATAFLDDAKRFHEREGRPCNPAPHPPYLLTWWQLSAAQSNWYFYWRSQVRRGTYLPTERGYIGLYAYELLNLVELTDPNQAAGRLRSVWEAYRKGHPELDDVLPEWHGDLLAVKVGPAAALDWWEKFAAMNIQPPKSVANALIERFVARRKSNEMPYTLWASLTDYRPRNKFYLAHNTDGRLDQAYEKAIRVAADYWQKANGQSLLEKFTETDARPNFKRVFEDALVGYAYPMMVDFGASRNYEDSAALKEHLTSVVKHAENILRAQAGVWHRLSGITLDSGIAAALEKAFAPVERPLQIKIDQSRVAALHLESERVGAMLEPPPEEATLDSPEAAYTDLAEVRQLWAALEGAGRATVTAIFDKSVSTVEQLAQQAQLPNVVIERVNEQALPVLGDRLIYVEADGALTLAEDFLDELQIVIGETPPTKAEAADGLWGQLLNQLTPAEGALLKLFAGRGALAESEIESAARPFHLMGNAVLDSLNEKATEALGHPPLYLDGEQWAVEEDDLPSLRQHFFS
ncbi:MAG: TerB N-terminal domain-containing protein [Chloroflexi bacterium]|nr:TerB N-terminal domain-containing protein [Chloroflexota bacterium]